MIGHDDLDLLAVRYVTGELAAAETTAFEARLADDQAARDAVEFAVRIAVVSADDAVAPEMSAAAVSPVRPWRLLAAAALPGQPATAGFRADMLGEVRVVSEDTSCSDRPEALNSCRLRLSFGMR